jgi:DNA-binding CsgD family transcriptional regulator
MAKIAAALHWAETDDRERAIQAGLRGAELAHTLGAEAERATLLTRVLDRWPRPNEADLIGGETRDDVLAEVMWAHSWGGSLSTSLDLIEKELAEASEGDPVRLLYLELTRSWLLRELGYPGSARSDTTVRDAIAVLNKAPRNALFFRCVAELASGTTTQETADALDGLLSEAIELAAERPTRALDRWQLSGAMSHHLRVLDRDDESATMLLGLLPQVRQEFQPSAVATWEANAAHRLATVGRFSEAADLGRGALLRLGDPRAAPRLWAYAAQSLADPLTELGEWDEAEHHLARAVDITANPVDTSSVLLDLGLIRSLRGEADAATALQTRATKTSPDEPEVDYQIAASLLASHIAMTVGDFPTARRALCDVWRRREYRREHGMWRVILLAVQVEVMARAAGPGATRAADDDLMDEIVAASRSTKAPGILGAAWGAHLAAEEARHRRSDSPALWQAAVDGWSATGQVHDKAWALLSLAVAQLDAGNRPAATTAVSDALDIGAELRAGPLLSKAELVARRGRLDLPRVGPERTSTRTLLHGLTARELEVIQLLGDGRSNDDIAKLLFISPKTASVHVSHILTKLGLTSRTEAAAFAHREGIVGP